MQWNVRKRNAPPNQPNHETPRTPAIRPWHPHIVVRRQHEAVQALLEPLLHDALQLAEDVRVRRGPRTWICMRFR